MNCKRLGFSPCHRTSHAKCPSAGNAKQFTDATQIIEPFVGIAVNVKRRSSPRIVIRNEDAKAASGVRRPHLEILTDHGQYCAFRHYSSNEPDSSVTAIDASRSAFSQSASRVWSKILDRPIGPACAVLFEIDIDRILFAATLDQPLLLPLSGAGRA